MPTVYVVNRGCHDFSAAERYGTLINLSESSMNRFDLSKIWRKFEPILAKSSPEDWILISGLTVMSIVATSIFATKHRRLNILMFKSQKDDLCGEYVGETIILGGSDGVDRERVSDSGNNSAVGSLRRHLLQSDGQGRKKR